MYFYCLNIVVLFDWQIEADQLREHVVSSWADQVSDREEVSDKIWILSKPFFSC